jgi:hypothetical protein
MPMTLPMVVPLKMRQAGRATCAPKGLLAPDWDVGGSSATPSIQPPGYAIHRVFAA